MATPSVFFGVSNYQSERWDRRQIFNRQAITGVNTAAPPSTNPGCCHQSPLTQELYLHSETGLEPLQAATRTWPCLQNLNHIIFNAAIRHWPYLWEAFIANTGSLSHKHMPAHEIRSQKKKKPRNHLTRTKSFLGVHLYLLQRLRMSGAVPLVSLYFFMAWASTTSPFATCLYHLGNKDSGCMNGRIIVMEQKISNWSKDAL